MALILFSIQFSNGFAQNLKGTYRDVVRQGIKRTSALPTDTISRADISHLPPMLQKHLELSGVIGQERVNNVKIVFKGRMRSNPDEPWMYFTSEQYNFFDEPTRAFYIKAKKMGIPANGLHLYKDEKAFMKIKLAGIFKIIDVDGQKMNQSETVTFLNDICFFAPAVLVDLENISYEKLDSNRLKATYTNGSQTISAVLIFNEKGRLINFISNHRYELINNQSYKRPWYTPIKEFTIFGKNTVPKQAEAWYKRTDSDFCYGEFTTVDVKYNIN